MMSETAEHEMIAITVKRSDPERESYRSYQNEIAIFCAGHFTDAGLEITEGWAQIGYAGDRSKTFTVKADPKYLAPILRATSTQAHVKMNDGTMLEITGEKMASEKKAAKRTDSPWCLIYMPAGVMIPARNVIRVVATEFKKKNLIVDLEQSKQQIDKETMTLKDTIHIAFEPINHYFTAHDLADLVTIHYTLDGNDVYLKPRFCKSFTDPMNVCFKCLRTNPKCLCGHKPAPGGKRKSSMPLADKIRAQRHRSSSSSDAAPMDQ